MDGAPHETSGWLNAALLEREDDGALRVLSFFILTPIGLSSCTTGSEYCGRLHCGNPVGAVDELPSSLSAYLLRSDQQTSQQQVIDECVDDGNI